LPVGANVTFPVGADFAPAAVSATVTVHDDAGPKTAGAHATAVVVDRGATGTLLDPELPACLSSPP
jgi:hypothetical protein